MNRVNRRGFLETGSLILGAGYASNVFGEDAGAQPKFQAASYEPMAVFLTWQGDPTTTMTVHWIGAAEEDGVSRPIWYREERGRIWQQQKSVPRRFPMTDHWMFRTEITGLEPGKEYRFRVGLDTKEHRFRTMPAKATNTIHFVSGGDSGVGPAAISTNQVAAKQAPMFVVLGGDLAY
jgi:phosphodiesterase/alkaline phosphatase D-like protein